MERGESHGAAPIYLKDYKADYGIDAMEASTLLALGLDDYEKIFKDVPPAVEVQRSFVFPYSDNSRNFQFKHDPNSHL